MKKRPILDRELDSRVFHEYYYTKEELVDFCKVNKLPTSGGKIEITDRIAHFLETGNILSVLTITRKAADLEIIYEDTMIESNFVCSQKHRAFFKKQIGKSFSFNVIFQKWLKTNGGKSYKDAVTAYRQIIEEKKKSVTIIDKQFEYNTYIRAFFVANKGKSLEEAIKCWKYKKQLQGHNRYESSDLIAIH